MNIFKYIRRFLLSIIIFSVSLLSADNDIIMVTSIPKCGTHMLMKSLNLLSGRDIRVNMVFNRTTRDHLGLVSVRPKSLGAWNSRYIMVSHLPFKDEYISELKKSPKTFKTFFIYRDPRDQVVSMAHWVYEQEGSWPESEKLSMNDLITHLIVDGSEVYGKPIGVKGFYEIWLPWRTYKNVCVTSFEKLVGPKGGGTVNDQEMEMKKISKHLGLNLTEEELRAKSESVFGEYHGAFRKGQIGGWKKHFTDEHKRLFKEHAGQLLIDLEYEKDFDW